MISVSEAQDIITKSIKPLPPQTFGLLEAAGKMLVEDVRSTVDIPAFAQSSMDGYAIKFANKNAALRIKGEMAAGTPEALSISDGEAARIFTGAPLPHGADTVVMQEKVRIENGLLILNDEALQEGNSVRRKGADVAAGNLAVSKGTVLTPAAIGFLAGIGVTEVSGHPLPSVTVIVTGNELQHPGVPLQPGQVYESNSFSLRAALQGAGIFNVSVHQAADDLQTLTALLSEALSKSNLVLLTGGVSVGDYDFVVKATQRCGVEQAFHKVKQRPGKPLYFGTKEGKAVFGLPGNPSSVLSCFYNYVLLAIEVLSKKRYALKKAEATLTKSLTKPAGLTQFLKGYFEEGKATPLGAQESFQLSSFAQANCLIRLEEGKAAYNEGDSVDVLLIPE